MNAIPVRSRVAIVALVTAAAVGYALAIAGSWGGWTRTDAYVAAVLFVMIILAEVLDITVPHPVVRFTVSVTSALALASGLQLGPARGGVVVMAAVLVESIYARRQPIKTVVNVANYGLSTLIGGLIYLALKGPDPSPLDDLRNIAALTAAGLVFALFNSATLCAVVAPIVGTSPVAMWWSNYGGIAVEMVALPTLGGLVPVLAQQHPLAMLFLVVPLVGPHLSFKGFQRAQLETRLTMERLADALERRDEYTHNHSVRVSHYVAGILHEMSQIPFEMAEAIRAAARVHDLGKVGVRDTPLNKAGPLTAEERGEIEQHPAIGAEIIDRLEVYRDGAAMVRHHHERWDGRGYPDGIAGEAIPLGARIIAVADTFDAMTSDRAYRRAMSPDVALNEICRQSGTQFDPLVVAAFERSFAANFGIESPPTAEPAPLPVARPTPRPETPPLPRPEPSRRSTA